MKNKTFIFLLFVLIIFFACSAEKKTLTADFIPPEDAEEIKDEKDLVQDEEKKNVIFAENVDENISTDIRIVLFESVSKESVESVSKRVMINLDKSIGIDQKDGLWRVLASGFKNKTEADKYIEYLKSIGWKNTYIDGFKKEDKEEPLKPVETEKTGIEYQIQLAAISEKDKAVEMQNNLKKLGYKNIGLVFESGLWKVRATKIYDETEAKNYLEQFRSVGFKDAWIIKVK
jgi:hypothetical protein